MVSPWSNGGRSSASDSSADKYNVLAKEESHGKHHSPLRALKTMGDKLRPHTAVTSTEEEPGVSDNDVSAGTAFPNAQHANSSALNAGDRDGNTSRQSMESTRSNKSKISMAKSFRSFGRSRTSHSSRDPRDKSGQTVTSPGKAGETKGSSNLPDAAARPEKYLKSANDESGTANDNRGFPEDPKVTSTPNHSSDQHQLRLASTQTSFQPSTQQAERTRRVLEHIRTETPPQQHDNAIFTPQLHTQDNSSQLAQKVQSRQSQAHQDPQQIPQLQTPNPSQTTSEQTQNPTVSNATDKASNATAARAPGTPLSPRSRAYYTGSGDGGQSNPSPDVASVSTAPGEIPPVSSQEAGASTASLVTAKDGSVPLQSRGSADTETVTNSKSTNTAETAGTSDALPSSDNSAPLTNDTTERSQKLNIPNGAVPGLDVGTEDPGLPGQVKESSDNYDQKAVDKKFGTLKQNLQKQRQLAADYVGWRQVGGWDARTALASKEESEDLLQRSTLLEYYISDKYIGDWYQNTVLVVATATMAWLVGHFGLSISWLSLVLLFSATAYRSSIRRMRRNYRDDLVREEGLQRIESDSESMEWLNSFMVKFWLIYEPSLSSMITQIGNEVLAEQTPGFIDSLSLEKFTLGTKAPRVEFIRSFPKTEPDIVVIDIAASFTPNDVMDLTARQLRTKVNPKIELDVRVGKAMISKSFPVLLQDMSFKGHMRLRIKLMENFPHCQTVDFSFLEPPDFDFVLKPIGGDTFGFDINIIPGLSKFIKDMVHANLGPMLYAPNAFQVNVEQLMAGVGIMTGVGVLSITIERAKDLRPDQDNRVDPYARLELQDKKELARTKIKANNSAPVWNETLNIIVTSLNQNVLLEVLDFNDDSKDRSIGVTSIAVDKIQGAESVTRDITSGGRRTGEISYTANFASVQMPQADGAGTTSGEVGHDTKSGILGLSVAGARELDATATKVGKLSSFCEIELDGKLVDSTKPTKATNDPEWNYAKEHIVLDKLSTLVVLRVRDNRGGHHHSPQVGIFKMRLMQLLIEIEKGREWFPLTDGKGEICIRAQWKPVNIAVGGNAVSNYVEPVGVLRVNILHANGLRNLEHVGKVDPYTRVFLGKRQVARTDWFKNELNPVWNQVLYIPVQNELQDVTFEVMDVEKRGKDRSLGAFKIDLKNIIQKDENDNYKVFISQKEFTNRLVIPNRGPKGTLTYTIEFYPAIQTISPSELDRLHSEQRIIAQLKSKDKLTPKEKQDLDMREDRLSYTGVEIPVQELAAYKSGVLAFSVISLTGADPGLSLAAFANNRAYPVFTGPPIHGKKFIAEECGDFVSGQMGLSSIRFMLGTGDATIPGEFKEVDELTLSCTELILKASRESKAYKFGKGEMEIQCRFFPLPDLIIDSSEDISKSGSVEVVLHKLTAIKAADSSGLSDPYVSFYLNNDNDKFYKSVTRKETLNPVYEESFRISVVDIQNTTLKAMVYDWDMGNRDDYLGGVKLDLSELEPLKWSDLELPLEWIKKTKDARSNKPSEGTINISLRYDPGELEKRADKDLVGLSGVSSRAGNLASDGVTAISGGVGAVGGVVGGAVTGGSGLLGKMHLGHHGHHDSAQEAENGTARFAVTIDTVDGFSGHEAVKVCGFILGGHEKEVFRSHTIKLDNGSASVIKTFDINAFPDASLGIKVLGVKSLGRTSDIGQGSVYLSSGTKTAEFGGAGTVQVSVEQI